MLHFFCLASSRLINSSKEEQLDWLCHQWDKVESRSRSEMSRATTESMFFEDSVTSFCLGSKCSNLIFLSFSFFVEKTPLTEGSSVSCYSHNLQLLLALPLLRTLILLFSWQICCNRCVLCTREAERYFFLVVALEGTGSPWLTVRCFRSDYASNECLTILLNYIRNLNKGCQALWQMEAAHRVIFKNAFYRQSMCCLRSFSPAVVNLSVPLFVCASTYN